jgi:hypothetical protein
MAIDKRKRGRPLEDPEHGPLSGKERKRRWREGHHRRRVEFRSAPLVLEGSGGLTYQAGFQGERELRRLQERKRGVYWADGEEERRSRGPGGNHEWDRQIRPEDGHHQDLSIGNPETETPEGEIPDLPTRVARNVDARQYPHRWANLGHRRGRVWVSDFSHQRKPSAEDQVFPAGEVTEVWEAYRLDLIKRRPWLMLQPAYLQPIVIALEDGPRPVSTFPAWLKPLLGRGLRRLSQLGVLREELKPNIWYKGRGRPQHYEVKVYSLEPDAEAFSAADEDDAWGESW